MAAEDKIAEHLRDSVETRAWNRVAARRRTYTVDWWATYQDLLQHLPQWVRHNGVRLTLEYLTLLTKRTSKAGQAAAVIADWAGYQTGDSPLSFAGLLKALNGNPPGSMDTVLLHRAALRDAQALRSYALLMPQTQITGGSTLKGPELAKPPVLAAPQGWDGLRELVGHPGLAWRYAGDLAGENYRLTQVQRLIVVSSQAGRCAAYALQYKRRKTWLKCVRQCHLREARLTSRLFTALGDKGVFETQVLLHPTHGLPVLSSTQLKAALRNHLNDRLSHLTEDKQEAWRSRIDELLGSAGSGGGLLTIHDAWWVPDEKESTGPVVGDMDNPHHTNYQRGQAPEARATDSPEPNPQTAVVGQLLLAVDPLKVSAQAGGPDLDWGLRALRWLGLALASRGVGGRVRAGAGRFEPPDES